MLASCSTHWLLDHGDGCDIYAQLQRRAKTAALGWISHCEGIRAGANVIVGMCFVLVLTGVSKMISYFLSFARDVPTRILNSAIACFCIALAVPLTHGLGGHLKFSKTGRPWRFIQPFAGARAFFSFPFHFLRYESTVIIVQMACRRLEVRYGPSHIVGAFCTFTPRIPRPICASIVDHGGARELGAVVIPSDFSHMECRHGAAGRGFHRNISRLL